MALLGSMHDARAEDLSPEAKRAEELNSEGKRLVGRLDLEGAAEKFRDAWQLVHDPRFAFNLCYTLEKSGKLYEAKAACQQALNAPDQRLAEKVKNLLKAIEEKIPPTPVPQPTTGPTGQPAPAGQPTPTVPTGYQPGMQPYPGGVYPGYQPTAYLVAPQRKTESYFTHVLIADAAAWSLVLLSSGADSNGLVGLGVVGLLVGSPIVHAMKGNSRGAWLSTGARLGMPFLGAVVGAASCSDLDGDCFGTTVGGAVLGYGGALLLDWFVFAKKETVTYSTQGMAMPTLELKDGGGIAGLHVGF